MREPKQGDTVYIRGYGECVVDSYTTFYFINGTRADGHGHATLPDGELICFDDDMWVRDEFKEWALKVRENAGKKSPALG